MQNAMRNIITRAMVAFAAMALIIACREDAPQFMYPELELHYDLKHVTSTSARISVTHNFGAGWSWYGFITEDLTTSGQQLFMDEIARGISEEELHASKQYVEVFDNLKPDTQYRYIGMGLDAEGTVYGKVSILEFKTLAENEAPGPDENGMMENEAWRVRYVGSAEVAGHIFDHVVRVSSIDSNSYAITVVDASEYSPIYLREMGEAFIADMRAYIDEFNYMNGTNYKLADMLYTGDNADAFNLPPGDYRAIAIGITNDGKLSGLYATSDEFEVKEAAPSNDYLSWIGEWQIEGMNNAHTTVTLSQDAANRSYTMTGWEGFNDLPIVVEYNAELNSIFFKSQLVAEHYYINEDYPDVNIYLFAGDDEGYYYDNSDGDYYIAIGGILDDGTRALVRYGVNVPDYPKFEQMFYMAEINGEFYGLSPEEDIPSFIAFMLPTTETAQHQMQMPMSVGRRLAPQRAIQLVER